MEQRQQRQQRQQAGRTRRTCVVAWREQHGGMETAEKQQASTARKVPAGWKPGQSGNPAGRPPLTQEQKLARRVQAKVINDVAAEMREHAAAAIKALRKVIDKGDGAEVTGAARLVLQYAFGNPKDSVDLTLNNGVRRITPEEIRTAALRLAASRADDVDIFE